MRCDAEFIFRHLGQFHESGIMRIAWRRFSARSQSVGKRGKTVFACENDDFATKFHEIEHDFKRKTREIKLGRMSLSISHAIKFRLAHEKFCCEIDFRFILSVEIRAFGFRLFRLHYNALFIN